MKDVIVLAPTQNIEVRAVISVERAISMILRDKPIASVLAAHPTAVFRSPTVTQPVPLVVMLHRYVRVSFSEAETAGNSQIRRRDSHTCAYCGKHGDTVDHVLPKSRGGQNTWANLVTACEPCNWHKDNRTPKEAGMALLIKPYRPVKYAAEQERARKIMADLAGVR